MNRTTIFLLALAVGASASALDVDMVSAGSLKDAVTSPESLTTLTLSGPIDASDLYFISREMPALTNLDLSGASIVAYNGERLSGHATYLDAFIPQNVFAGSGLQTVTLPAQEGLRIGDGAFAGSQLKSVSIGANVTEIGNAAFASCPVLQSATIASRRVGIGAFAACPTLGTVTFTTDATSLDANAFADDAALRQVKGSKKVSTIGARAFEGCSALSAYDFGPTLTAIGDAAFARSGLTEVNLSAVSPLLGHWAFAECRTLTKADLSGIAAGGDGVVFDCPSLTSFVAPSGDAIAPYTFALSTSLPADILVPAGTAEIGSHALHGLTQVTEITLPDGITTLGDGAMAGMSGLQQINTHNTQVPALGRDVWAGVDQSTVILLVPEGSVDAYSAADQWKNFRITDEQSANVDTPEADIVRPALRGRFVGNELQVEATGADIERLSLHNVAGIMLLTVEPASAQASVDTAGLQGQVFIVAAILSDGSRATLKLARR